MSGVSQRLVEESVSPVQVRRILASASREQLESLFFLDEPTSYGAKLIEPLIVKGRRMPASRFG